MAQPTFVSYTATDWTTTGNLTKDTASIAVTNGDVLVAVTAMDRTAETLSAPTTQSGSTSAWSAGLSLATVNHCAVRLHTATATATGNIVVRFTASTTGMYFGGGVYVLRASDGVGTPVSAEDGGAPSLNITTTAANSAIVVINADWAAVDGSTRTWRTVNSITPTAGNGYEPTGGYARDANQYTVYSAYYPDAGAAEQKTVGLSAPTGQTDSIIAIEVKGTAGGTTHTDVAWGEETPTEGEDPIAWTVWKRESDGGAVTVTGDAEWGTLSIASGEPVVSDVIDTGDATEKTFTIDYNVYDTGGTPGVIQIRGSDTTFAWDAGSPGPEWANYTAPTAQSWQYVQVRLAYS